MTDTTRDALNDAIMEHLGPAALTGGKMSILEAFELGWQAAKEQGKRQWLTCVWTDQDDEYMPGTYASACGEMWSFTDGGVAENNVRFCQGCGKAVEVHGITPPQGKI